MKLGQQDVKPLAQVGIGMSVETMLSPPVLRVLGKWKG